MQRRGPHDARIQTTALPFSLNPEELGTCSEWWWPGSKWPSSNTMCQSTPSCGMFHLWNNRWNTLVDAGRIKHVLTTCLTNACTSSPPERPVKVQLRVEDALDQLWERFYRAKGSAVQP